MADEGAASEHTTLAQGSEDGCDEAHFTGDREGGALAWLVVMSCTFARFLDNSYMAYGIFHITLLEKFGKSSWETALVGSICFGFTLGAGPIASILCNFLTHRVTCILGSLLMSLGYIVSAYATNIYVLYFSYGCLIGTGAACLIIVGSTMPGFYFEKKRLFVTGIVSAGGGIGSLVFPILVQYLIDEVIFTETMMIISGICLQGCIAGALLRPQRRIRCARKLQGSNEQQFDLSLFRNWSFLVYTCAQLMRGLHSFVVFTAIPDDFLGKGFDKNDGAYWLSVAGISSTIARVLIGTIANVGHVDPVLLFTIIALIPVVSILTLAFDVKQFVALMFMAVIFGGSYGMSLALLSTTTIELFGLHRMTSALGYCLVGEGIGGFLGPALTGYLYDTTGSYSAAYFVASAAALAGGLIMIPVLIKHRKKRRHIVVDGI